MLATSSNEAEDTFGYWDLRLWTKGLPAFVILQTYSISNRPQLNMELPTTERSGSQQGKLAKGQTRSELTPEQIQQQNILRLNGFSSSTILKNASVNNSATGSPILSGAGYSDIGLASASRIVPNGNNGFNAEPNERSTDGINNGDIPLNSISNPDEEIDDDALEDMDKFGLKGLISLLRHEDNDQNNIAKGIDLNMLGLNLSLDNKSHILSKTLSSPWLETSRSEVEPLFTKPDSFTIKPNDLLPIEDRISSFNDLTLFFIFYTKPRDILQELSARELNRRNWRYHKELQVWLTKDTNSEPKAAGIGAEEGTYIFFDPVSWEFVTKTLVLYYNSII